MSNTTNTTAASVATDFDDALMAREMYESQDDSLLLCASDLQHSAIYDNHIEMQSCIRAVADRITALASVIDGVEREALAATQPAARGAAQAAPVDAAVQQDAERWKETLRHAGSNGLELLTTIDAAIAARAAQKGA